jgi:type I restriction enzyme, S subunit
MNNYQASIKSYSSYKDSTIAWLGEVPEHWKIQRVKDVGIGGLTNGLFKKKDDFGYGVKLINVSDLYQSNNTIKSESLDRVNASEEEVNRYRTVSGDIFFVRSSLKLEGIGVSALLEKLEEITVFECHIIRFRPNIKQISSKFLNYFFNSEDIKWKFIILSKTVTMTTISQEKISSIELAIPPHPEQKSIAHYLDTKTAEIDRKIDLLTQKAELYVNLKRSLINETVTRGLDRSVPMKDSGVEWLGDVPEHWEICRAKDTVKRIGNGVTPRGGSEVYTDSGIPLLRSQNVYDDGLRIDNVSFIPIEIHVEMQNSQLKANDVLINITGASIGRTCIVPIDFGVANINQHIAFLRVKNWFNATYIALFIKSCFIKTYIQREQNGASKEAFNLNQIANIPLVLPPLPEQKTIATYLDTKTTQIDQITQTLNTQIEKLKELRKTLINDVVTGKIKVTDNE